MVTPGETLQGGAVMSRKSWLQGYDSERKQGWQGKVHAGHPDFSLEGLKLLEPGPTPCQDYVL